MRCFVIGAAALLGSGGAAAAELGSAHFRMRAEVVSTTSGGARDGSSSYLVDVAVGVPVVGTLRGEATGIALVGGLWPVLVGAAFDQDRDLVPNVTDNCTAAGNTLQVDADVDGYGNACDADLTNDNIVNFGDLARLKRAFLTADPIADLNGDGVVNFGDLAIMKKAFLKPPGPAAGKP